MDCGPCSVHRVSPSTHSCRIIICTFQAASCTLTIILLFCLRHPLSISSILVRQTPAVSLTRLRLTLLLLADFKVALIQRSCGYSLRSALTVTEIGELIAIIKETQPECLVLVDNCYGEFTEGFEPGLVSAQAFAACKNHHESPFLI